MKVMMIVLVVVMMMAMMVMMKVIMMICRYAENPESGASTLPVPLCQLLKLSYLRSVKPRPQSGRPVRGCFPALNRSRLM